MRVVLPAIGSVQPAQVRALFVVDDVAAERRRLRAADVVALRFLAIARGELEKIRFGQRIVELAEVEILVERNAGRTRAARRRAAAAGPVPGCAFDNRGRRDEVLAFVREEEMHLCP